MKNKKGSADLEPLILGDEPSVGKSLTLFARGV
ncbi:hypothetical protein Metal_1955 [Methylomicrobium album BG8]|uniref:Uncharacterized protein n=1 Tax=Methylomicrobium album BG8 TaxID=686340 RepID=H8GPU2_METAL|nr:hypothetical protein Metal_1955 [Methylomicrobium album BG8]